MSIMSPNQKHPGGWVPPEDGGHILVLSIRKSPSSPYVDYMSFFSPIYHSGSGGGPFASIPYDLVGSTFLFFNVAIPGVHPDDYSCTSGIEYQVVTHPNHAGNNDKYKDIAYKEQEYVPFHESFSTQKWPWSIPVEGVGSLNGAYHINGYMKLEGDNLHISGIGRTNAQYFGDVRFWLTATVYVNGKEYSKKALAVGEGHVLLEPGDFYLGTADISLPKPMPGQKVTLELQGSYTITVNEGTTGPFPDKYLMDVQIRDKA